MKDWKIGDTVFWVSRNNRQTKGCETVTAVGRKWVTLGNGNRFEKETLRVDGGNYSPPGEVFLTEQEFLDTDLANRLRSKLIRYFSYSGEGARLDLAKLREVASVIGMEIEKP